MSQDFVSNVKNVLNHRLFLPYLFSALFIVANTVFIANELYWLALLPVVGIVFLLYFYSLDWVLLIITFLTPLSVNIRNFDVGIGLSLPTEPLMVGVLLLFIIKLFKGDAIERRLVFHPVSIIVILMLGWMLITSITSEIPLVSFKYLLSRLWFVVPFFFLGVPLFRQRQNMYRFIWAYALSFAVVVIYSSWRLYSYGFDQQAAHWVMDPFYNDHTAYGAALSLFLAPIAGIAISGRVKGNTLIAYLVVAAILLMGFVLSMSRAAWVSMVAAVAVFVIIRFRVKFVWLFAAGLVGIGLLIAYQDVIINRLEKNKQESSADLKEHVQSISNIRSDASNLERINRWDAALRMFKERPLVGWGPGTYQFVYGPYQRSSEKTIISTNAGDLGNVHSEYLGPLSEWGLPGLLIILALVASVVHTALKILRRSKDWETRLITLAVFTGLITYFVHGFLNNFLDTDKASVPFWGFIAILVAIDLYHLPKVKAEYTETIL